MTTDSKTASRHRLSKLGRDPLPEQMLHAQSFLMSNRLSKGAADKIRRLHELCELQAIGFTEALVPRETSATERSPFNAQQLRDAQPVPQVVGLASQREVLRGRRTDVRNIGSLLAQAEQQVRAHISSRARRPVDGVSLGV
ncbi:hypothetical protein HYQ46_003437 [Verticillium longisporum]|nr:hypothetical protein HYQ46_003437 [Verticillium longisporum]